MRVSLDRVSLDRILTLHIQVLYRSGIAQIQWPVIMGTGKLIKEAYRRH